MQSATSVNYDVIFCFPFPIEMCLTIYRCPSISPGLCKRLGMRIISTENRRLRRRVSRKMRRWIPVHAIHDVCLLTNRVAEIARCRFLFVYMANEGRVPGKASKLVESCAPSVSKRTKTKSSRIRVVQEVKQQPVGRWI